MQYSFYPGPSQVYPQVGMYMQQALASGILSANHRSNAFMDLWAETKVLFHEKLLVPRDYTLYITSSATECWEITAQSLIGNNSLNFYNGAFGQKWLEYTKKLANGKNCVGKFFAKDEEIKSINQPCEVLCLTQNETSNGTQIPIDDIGKLSKTAEITVVDATSSMAGINLPWAAADVWFASVQKCFGLPAGLAVMVCSPKALKHAQLVNDHNHYNSLLFIHENFGKNQTPYTPNVLGIYLLNRVLNQIPSIKSTNFTIKNRAQDWYRFFAENCKNITLYIENEAVRSDTVIVLQAKAEYIKSLLNYCASHGITLGKGYGPEAASTFRIANFPAITDEAIGFAQQLIQTHYNNYYG